MSDVSQIDGSAVRLKREAQGWALADMANRACLSVKQIRQIEEGGMTAFYSESVKLTAARKVAALLQMSESQLFGQQPAPTPPEEDHFQHVSAQADTPKFSASMAAVPAPTTPLMRGEALHELAQPPAFIEEGPSEQAPATDQATQAAAPQDVPDSVQPAALSDLSTSAEPQAETSSTGSGYMMKIAALFVVALAAAALLNPNLLDKKLETPATAETPAPPVLPPPPGGTDSAPAASDTPVAPGTAAVSTTPNSPTTTPASPAAMPAATTAPASGQ
ncbi:MAG: hypothetical protein RI998_1190 [Pseudomonadota bacterium]